MTCWSTGPSTLKTLHAMQTKLYEQIPKCPTLVTQGKKI